MKNNIDINQGSYDILEFVVNNKEVIRNDMKQYASNFLENEKYFNGLFYIAYINAFEEFIISILREVLIKHNLPMDQIYSIIDKPFLDEWLDDYFFDRQFYKEL